ncbi:MAG: hypothetical protein H6R15_190 [Proteobacteria bacterium]|nr:hypothetical protein [Pseudomonadota bacterium]
MSEFSKAYLIVLFAVAIALSFDSHADSRWPVVSLEKWPSVSVSEIFLPEPVKYSSAGGYGAVSPKKYPPVSQVRYCMEKTIYGYYKQVVC